MKKTKIVVGVLSLIMAFNLVGCGNDSENKIGIENNNEIIISGENNDENLEQSETGVKTAEELKIPFELKEENIVEENFEYDYDVYFNISTKMIEYSLEHEKLNGPIYFGYLEGFQTDHKAYFIEYNNQIVATYDGYLYDMVNFKDIMATWKDAVSVLDFNEKDEFIEIEISMMEMDWMVYDFYRISKDEFINMGSFRGGLMGIDLENNRIYTGSSYLRFIEEKVLTNYYEIVDNKLVHVCKFEDGRVSVTDWEHEGDFSELSKNEYTVATPVFFWDEKDSTTSSGYKELEIGEKIKILEINDVYFEDAKVQRANGEIVDVTMQVAGRT